jgi:magnesium-dependent phosphatase 1
MLQLLAVASLAGLPMRYAGLRLPRLAVLDLDMCVWSPEMYLLSDDCSNPTIGDLSGRGEGVVGINSGYETIRIFPGALEALQDCLDHLIPAGMRLAVASSADTPRAVEIGRQAMSALEIVPGTTLLDVLRMGWDGADDVNLKVGRSAPLTSDKSQTHFPLLRDETGIPYDEMVFWDDSVWSDHCEMVARNCKGVVTVRTPKGLTMQKWVAGLEKFSESPARAIDDLTL